MKRGGMLRAFGRDSRGVAATEFVLIAPMLLLLLLGSFTIFDWLRASYIAERATFTISDLISRQTVKNDATFGKFYRTFEQLSPRSVDAPQLRVMSVIHEPEGYRIDWIYNATEGSLADSAPPLEDLPDVSLYDSVILTQTETSIRPTFSFLFDTLSGQASTKGHILTLKYSATTRPRSGLRIAER